MADLTTSMITLRATSNLTATAYITIISTIAPPPPASTSTSFSTPEATAAHPHFIYNPYHDHDNIGKPHTSSASALEQDSVLLFLIILTLCAYSLYWSVLTQTLEFFARCVVEVFPALCKGWNRGMRMIEEGGWWRYRREILVLGFGFAMVFVREVVLEPVAEVMAEAIVDRLILRGDD